MLNSIYETRTRLDEGYHISLTIPKEEYTVIYGNDINEQHATEIINDYLQHRDDDGEAHDIKIYDHEVSNMIEIEAKLNYIGNEHTDYNKSHGELFSKNTNE
ncbi:hypothetical protein [Vallitalea guaymasensis]|uniref:hypothetical protein n=1 Tax=Vallitalea guaymasensis TaxID=1185412 RepID=UPI00272CD953|nr:hypothetical protein [Vallitalea guaymasensis]